MRQNLTFADQSLDMSAISVLSPKTPSVTAAASARRAGRGRQQQLQQTQEESFQFLHRKKDAFEDVCQVAKGKSGKTETERKQKEAGGKKELNEPATRGRRNKDDENPSTSKKKQKENNVSRENSPQPVNTNPKPPKSKRKREPSPPADPNISPHGRPIRQRRKNTKYQ